MTEFRQKKNFLVCSLRTVNCKGLNGFGRYTRFLLKVHQRVGSTQKPKAVISGSFVSLHQTTWRNFPQNYDPYNLARISELHTYIHTYVNIYIHNTQICAAVGNVFNVACYNLLKFLLSLQYIAYRMNVFSKVPSIDGSLEMYSSRETGD
jgi:hypothetical protein